jgi:hypothetical protein
MEVSQEEFEHTLMNLLLQGDHPILATLRQQYEMSTITNREFTGVGFYSTIEVPDTLPLVNPPNYAAGFVEIDLEMLSGGAGCVLWITNGKLASLECYTYGTEQWPDKLFIKSLSNVIPAIPNKSPPSN